MAACGETEFVLRWVEAGRNAFAGVQGRFKSLRENIRGFNDVMSKNMQVFKEDLAKMKSTENAGARFGTQLRELTHGARGFRMELLGVMFFGMALQRTFLGLLKPALQTAGVFEIWATILQVVFLPVALAILPVMLKFMDLVMNLPKPVKGAIGVFVVLGVVLGTLLFWAGQLLMGLGALIIVFGENKVIEAFAKPVVGLIVRFKKLIAVIRSLPSLIVKVFKGITPGIAAAVTGWVALIFGFIVAFKKNYGHMRGWFRLFLRGIGNMFKGLWDVLVGIVRLVIAIFKGDWKGAGQALKQIWSGIVRFFGGAIQTIVSFIAMIGVAIWSAGGEIGKAIGDGVRNAWRHFFDWVNKVKPLISAFGRWIWNTLRNAFSFDFNFNLNWGSKARVTSAGRHNDFLWRPGQGAISIAPNDTIIGSKDLGSLGGGQPVQIVNNFNGITDRNMLERMLDDRDRRIARDLRRLANPR